MRRLTVSLKKPPDPARPPGDLHTFGTTQSVQLDKPPSVHFNLSHRISSIFIYSSFLVLCNVAIPVALYYPLRHHTNLSAQTLIGVSSGALGVSSCFDGPYRTWKLYRHQSYYGPLGSTSKWAFDFTNHLYTLALFVFAIPLAVASALNPPLEKFFLMSTAMLVAPFGIVLAISLFRPKLPFRCSSDPAHVPCKPAFYYLVEDVSAVDLRHGRKIRQELNDRYTASPILQQLFWVMTLFWAVGCGVYFGITAAVTWTLGFDTAFGFVLGQLFVWLLVWALASTAIASYYLKKEAAWFASNNSLPADMVHTDRVVEIDRQTADAIAVGQQTATARA